MSRRFPTIASQSELNRSRAQVRVRALPQAPSLPWLELALGLAFLLLLRGI